MNIYDLTELQKEAALVVLDALKDVEEGVYYSELITALYYYFEFTYEYEARDFITKNIEEILEILEDLSFNYGSLDEVLFDRRAGGGISIFKFATICYSYMVEQVYYEFLNEFEKQTQTDLTNKRIYNDSEEFKAFTQFVEDVLKNY